MTIIAKGADQVRRLQHALRGGDLPASTIEAFKARIQRDCAERFEARKTAHAERNRLTERRRRSLLSLVPMDDPHIIQEAEETRKRYEALRKRPIQKPERRLRNAESCVVTGSLEWFMNPPFDGAVSWPPPQQLFNNSNGTQEVLAEASTGLYGVSLQVCGGGTGAAVAASAGVYVSFVAPVAPPGFVTLQSFSALSNCTYSYWDEANFWTSDDDFQTQLLVWGETENDWVGSATISPSWSHHDTWLGHNSNSVAQLSSGIANFFAGSGQNYIGYMGCEGYAEGDGGGPGWGGAVIAYIIATAEYMAFSEAGLFPLVLNSL
jgi:hypothetical protein